MKADLAENFRIGFYVWLIVMICVYGPIFGWHVVKAVYEDHESLAAQVQRLENAPKQLPCRTCPTCPTPKACGGGGVSVKTARRAIQEKLANLMNEGIILRVRWLQLLAHPQAIHRPLPPDIPYCPAKIKN